MVITQRERERERERERGGRKTRLFGPCLLSLLPQAEDYKEREREREKERDRGRERERER